MIASHYVYDTDTGRILLTHRGKRHQIEHNMKSGSLVDLVVPRNIEAAKHYHKNGAIADRPVIEVPESAMVDVAIGVSGVPSGVDIIINGAVVGVSDGTDTELMFDLDGEYEIEVKPPFPYIPVKTKITVTP